VSADLILREVRGRGVELKVVGDELLYRPKGALTEDLRAALLKHKAALVNLLVQERRDLERAGRRGLVIRWSEYPDWIEHRSEADYIHHTWSPDETKMAFSSGRPPDFIHDIYTMNLDGSNQINLTNTPDLNEMHPDFSPDGSQICFSRDSHGRPKPASGIYVMDADGSDPTLLAGESGAGQCDWSPDGRKMAFNRNAGVHGLPDVCVMNADGSGQMNLTNSNSDTELDPDWSPDGTKITFESNRDGAYPDIYTMDPDGSDVAQLTTNSGVSDMDPNWQPLPRPTIHPPDTGGLSLLLVASALLFSMGVLLFAVVKRRM
jgi:hypothetical protein